MKRKSIRNPLTGLRVPVAPSRDEIKRDLLDKINVCILNFSKTRDIGWVTRYKHLRYELWSKFGERPPPLY